MFWHAFQIPDIMCCLSAVILNFAENDQCCYAHIFGGVLNDCLPLLCAISPQVPSRAEEITIPADVTPEKVPTHIVDYSGDLSSVALKSQTLLPSGPQITECVASLLSPWLIRVALTRGLFTLFPRHNRKGAEWWNPPRWDHQGKCAAPHDLFQPLWIPPALACLSSLVAMTFVWWSAWLSLSHYLLLLV